MPTYTTRPNGLKLARFADRHIEQINVTHDDFPGHSALLTRFAGSREWSVSGHCPHFADPVRCCDGPNLTFTRSQALEMAELFVLKGRTFL